MPLTEAQENPIAEIENQLGLPAGFLRGLYDHEDDWSFVIKSHAFLEAALTHLLADHLGKEDLLPVFAYLETSNVRTGQRPMGDRLRSTLDRIVLDAPRLALVTGVAMIGLDIYFKNRGTQTPRQYVILLGEMAIKEWEALQDPAAPQ